MQSKIPNPAAVIFRSDFLQFSSDFFAKFRGHLFRGRNNADPSQIQAIRIVASVNRRITGSIFRRMKTAGVQQLRKPLFVQIKKCSARSFSAYSAPYFPWNSS